MSYRWSEEALQAIQQKRGSAKTADTKPSNKPMYALGRLPAGTMNNTEQSYEEYLKDRQHLGEVAWFKFEAIKLRLATKTFYSADFFVMLADGQLQVHEVKGFWTDDARVKIKVAASLYPFKFIAVKKNQSGSGWVFEEF